MSEFKIPQAWVPRTPVPLWLLFWVLHGGESMERKLHEMFRSRRAHGEWFRVDEDELKATVQALIAERRAARGAGQ